MDRGCNTLAGIGKALSSAVRVAASENAAVQFKSKLTNIKKISHFIFPFFIYWRAAAIDQTSETSHLSVNTTHIPILKRASSAVVWLVNCYS